MAFTIKVNGNTHSVDVDGDTPLLWVLRDVLGMTGTKFGCGMALCGACTVHVDGVATRSCITPIDSIGSLRDHDNRGDRRDAGGRQDPEGLARPRGRAMRLLPVGPDHVRVGAAGEQPASDGCRHRRRDVRQHLPLRDLCPHSRSDQAGRAIERTGRLTMILDHIASRAAGSGRSPSANGLSRRSFLQAGAAAGGGLMLSLQLAVRKRRSRSGRRRWLRAQRLHPHRTRRADYPDHALCRDGPGHLHLDPDADRRRAGGGPETGAAGACSAQRKALRQSLAWRRAGNRQLERGTRGLAAAAPGRCDRENHARVGGGKALECRSGVLPRAKRRSASRADGETASNMASLPPTPPACRSPKAWRSSGRRISSSSARRPSVWTRRRRSTERPSMASTFGRRA